MNYPSILHVFLVVTHRCNLACKYCFVNQENLDMDPQVAIDTVDYLAKNIVATNQNCSIAFFGGEPLLRWNDIIVPTVLYAEKIYPDKKFNFSITTNCVLLTEDKINFIKEHNIGILTSIDGCKETQDFNRPFHNGTGSFEIVENNIKKYREIVGLDKATFRSTVYPPTSQYLYKNYLYAIDFGYKSMFFITDCFSEWSKDKEIIVKAQLDKICLHYVNYWREYKKAPIIISTINKYLPSVVNDLSRKVKGLQSIAKKPVGKCGYGQGRGAAVSPVGDLYGCQEMTSNEGPSSIFYIGNIYDDVSDERRLKLKEIFESSSPSGDIECENCCAKVFCDGGCIANNYMINGDMNKASHGYCFFMRLIYEASAKIYNTLKDLPEFTQTLQSKNIQKEGCGACQQCQATQDKNVINKSGIIN